MVKTRQLWYLFDNNLRFSEAYLDPARASKHGGVTYSSRSLQGERLERMKGTVRRGLEEV
jgi:hypothetical protein